MIKIFETGDNHFGKRYDKHDAKEYIIQKRMDAFENMIQKANDECCDLFVITGDLFDNNRTIPENTVSAVFRFLHEFNGTVLVLPGNHDFYSNDSKLWISIKKVVSDYDNIVLLTEYRPYLFTIGNDKIEVYPAHCTSLHSESGQNNLDWIKALSYADHVTYRIGIAHGAVEGKSLDSEGKYFSMSEKELYFLPMDLWLVGHTHVPFPNNLTDDFRKTDEKIFNAGAHCQEDVSNNTPGYCFIFELNDDKSIWAKQYISGKLRFLRKEVKISEESLEDAMIRAVRGVSDDTIVDLILSGGISHEDYTNRDSIIGGALSRFIEFSYEDSELGIQLNEDIIRTEFPENSLSAEVLLRLMDSPKEAQMMYDLLNSLKGDSK